eukprot:CAMPEP_0181337614 /NCGR_PEP_ID=MMETSP1101-20121128/28124_1 /TAXON_ID=46948 /ORGANISM="Rhodomonas abbreviata, Strain Caron Lab Isolate" /LENGTH=1371 /DNA_ID=CAMNT_0023448143 /DNA_START=311 /DNA_END=4426 /DNA_ORIENTATION=+
MQRARATDTFSQALPGISSSFTLPSFYSRHECSKCGRSVLVECSQNPAHLICVREEMARFVEFMDLHIIPSEGSYLVVKPSLEIMDRGRCEMVCCVLRSSLLTIFTALGRMRLDFGNGVAIAEVHYETLPSKSSEIAPIDDNVVVHVDLGVETSLAASKALGGLDGVVNSVVAKLAGYGCTVERKETSIERRLRQLSASKMAFLIRRQFIEVLRNPGNNDFRAFTPPEFKNWKGTGSPLPAQVQVDWRDRSTNMLRPKMVSLPEPNIAVELVAAGSTQLLGMVHSEVILATCDFFDMVLEGVTHCNLDHTTAMKAARSSKKKHSTSRLEERLSDGADVSCSKLQFNGSVVMPGTVRALISFLYSSEAFREHILADPPSDLILLQLLRLSFLLGLLYLHRICESLIYQRFSDDLNVMSQISECFRSSAGVSDPLQECRWFFPEEVITKLEGRLATSRNTKPDVIEPLSLAKLPQGSRDTLFAPQLRSQCLFLSQAGHQQYRLHQPVFDLAMETFVTWVSKEQVLQEVNPTVLEWSFDTWRSSLRSLMFKVSNLRDEQPRRVTGMQAVLAFSGPLLTERCVTFNTTLGPDRMLRLELTEEEPEGLANILGANALELSLHDSDSKSGDSVRGRKRVRLQLPGSLCVVDIAPRTTMPGGQIVVSVLGGAPGRTFASQMQVSLKRRQPATRCDVYAGESGVNHEPRALECCLAALLVESSNPKMVAYSIQIPDTAREGEYEISLFPPNEREQETESRNSELASLTIIPTSETALASTVWRQNPELPNYRPKDCVTSYLFQVFQLCHTTEVQVKQKWFQSLCPDHPDDFDLAQCHVFTTAIGKVSASPGLGYCHSGTMDENDILQSCLIVLHTDEQDEIICRVGAHHLLAMTSQGLVRSTCIVPAEEAAAASSSPHVIMIWDYLRRNPAKDCEAHASLDDLCRFITNYVDSGDVDLRQFSLYLDAEPETPKPEPAMKTAQESRVARDEEDLGDLRAAESTGGTERADSEEHSVIVCSEKGEDVETYTDLKAVRRKGSRHCKLFKAWDKVSGAPVALKVLKSRAKRGISAGRSADNFEREWAALELLSTHPSDYVVRGIARLDAWNCLVMPWYEGETLLSVMSSSSGPAASKFVDILHGLTVGLSHMHGLGWVHGSVCPGNVLLTKEFHVKLTGLVFASPSPATFARSITHERLSFSAPECDRACTSMSDVYSVGAIILFWFKGVHHSRYLEPSMQAHIRDVIAFALSSESGHDSGNGDDLLSELIPQPRNIFLRWERSFHNAESRDDVCLARCPPDQTLLLRATKFLVQEEIVAGSGIQRLMSDADAPLRQCAKSMEEEAQQTMRELSKHCLEVQPDQRTDLKVELLSFVLNFQVEG